MDKRALYDLSYGLYLIGATAENMPTGCIVNTVFQVSSEPPRIAVSINHDNYTNSCVQNIREFSVSILSEKVDTNILSVFGFSSGKDKYKFENIEHRSILNNLPVLTSGITGWLHCKVENIVDVGSHAIFIAEVIDSEKVSDEPAMTYAYYHSRVKGKAPKNAPTYREEEAVMPVREITKYICSVCGYSVPAAEFESLPDDWVCPICGAKKSDFVPA